MTVQQERATACRPWIEAVRSAVVPAEQSTEAAFTKTCPVGDVLDLANQISRQAKQGPWIFAGATADERFGLNLADD